MSTQEQKLVNYVSECVKLMNSNCSYKKPIIFNEEIVKGYAKRHYEVIGRMKYMIDDAVSQLKKDEPTTNPWCVDLIQFIRDALIAFNEEGHMPGYIDSLLGRVDRAHDRLLDAKSALFFSRHK